MQKNAGEKTLRWLVKTNSQSKNSTPTGRCQAETGKFAEVNFFGAGNDLHPLYRKALDLFAGAQYTFYAVSHK
jgi:hypothetical protein